MTLALLVACAPAPLADSGEWTADDHPQPARGDVDQGRVPQRARPERSSDPLAAAAALWTVTCASCHGRTGLGDGPAAPGRLVSFADPEWQRANDDAAIVAVITNGRNMMPPFGEVVAPAGIEALVALIRRFGASAPTEGAPAPSAEDAPAPAADAPSEAAVEATE
ncbi:MAG: cytochrome c [Myxococcales bacterium]|nr:cytochrome c [Myxococcales bacterium]